MDATQHSTARRALAFAALISAPGSTAHADPAVFESPEVATEAVISALEARDRPGLIAVFGPENEDVILTGDDVVDRQAWSDFLSEYRTMHRIDVEDDMAALYIGR